MLAVSRFWKNTANKPEDLVDRLRAEGRGQYSRDTLD